MSGEVKPPVGWPRWAKVALTASVALNLAVVGIVAGAVIRGPNVGHMAANLPIDGFRGISRAMPSEDRAALREDVRANRADFRAAHRALRRSRAEFLTALRTEPFSPETVAEVFDTQAEVWNGLGQASRQILIERIAAMTPEARAAFADNLEKSLRRRHRSDRPARDGPPE
ncbi:MAG: periplasmic heavy metal sensor [Pseudomonadota bacterium]